MSDILLSICMPTHNFGAFIGETIASILPQLREDIELVILDGASTDNTHEIVSSYQKTCPRIFYHKKEIKGGIDPDIAETVSHARGKYVWLFSSDDIMKEGAVSKVLQEIKEGQDLYLCGITLAGLDISKTYWNHPIFKLQHTKVWDLSKPTDRMNFLEAGTTTTAFFSFMGNLIFKKEVWDAAENPSQYFGTFYAHAARFFQLMPKGLTVKFSPEPLLVKRAFNDSFMDKGIVNRISITIDGFFGFANSFFSPEERIHLRRVVRNELPLSYILILVKSQVRSLEERDKLDKLVCKLYQDSSFLNMLRRGVYRIFAPGCLRPLTFVYKYRSFFKHINPKRAKELFSKRVQP